MRRVRFFIVLGMSPARQLIPEGKRAHAGGPIAGPLPNRDRKGAIVKAGSSDLFLDRRTDCQSVLRSNPLKETHDDGGPLFDPRGDIPVCSPSGKAYPPPGPAPPDGGPRLGL